MTNSSTPHNQALTPIPQSDRVFGWHEHASLWFSLGVGLLVMQVGAYLVPAIGTKDAVMAILLGSIVGSGLLAWVARTGCNSGLSSAGLIHCTYGNAFARLPVLLNIIQLLGWTTFELVIMREGTTAITRQAFGIDLGGSLGIVLVTLFWGAILMALLAGSMITLVRKFISRFGLPLVVLSLIWLSWQFLGQLQTQGFEAMWNRQGNGSMSMFSAMDLVIAMPVSWLPLVADYARHGRSGRGAMGGTWLGYTVANIWCYALGVVVVSVAEPNTSLVSALLLAQGGLIALGLIMIDELDNAYGDLYSGSVSTHSLMPRWSIRRWGLTLAVVSMVLATLLPMHTLEPFLLMLSSIFVPLYGVILGRQGFVKSELRPDGRAIDWTAAALWLLGIACYHGIGEWAPGYGSALPTLAITFALAALTRK
ncbi:MULTISPECIES: cytosine permease [unclassified Pusillimonas]|uniref:purine-cytosine permease family protein n=1 Tax=unclassified Pusillimonas TaxID=2640016 RepID=UPI000B9CDB42|nr:MULTISPECIES: cytosine permease [unclassified Pusillimonas]OXR49726.1 allantoin permease [Pusillimonas sp. T2]ROT45128.1 allantoin permease [Pusillimonas sp. NJUB218]